MFLFIFNNNNIFITWKGKGRFEENTHEDFNKCFTTCEHEQQSNEIPTKVDKIKIIIQT